MKKSWIITALSGAFCITGSVALLSGCAAGTTAPAPTAKADTPKPPEKVVEKPMEKMDMSAKPKMAMMTGCPDKMASHMVATDEPIFTSAPSGQGAVPVGMIKAGSKVLSMVPGAEYTKCMIEGDKTVYIKTSALKPYSGTN